jgi:hypothetical protein
MQRQSDPLEGAPPEVLTFLREMHACGDPALRINLLTLTKSRQYSIALQQTEVGESLGLIALDDANDSNPYCYINRGICRGMVIHFSHDPEPEIRFRDLASFSRSLATALSQGLEIDELPFESLSPHDDQQGLIGALGDLANRDDNDATFLICLFIPLLDPGQISVIERLANHESFFVRERLAEFLANYALPEHRSVAQKLAEDPHPQVARPGKKALSHINRGPDRTQPGR